MSAISPLDPLTPDPAHALTPSGNLRRREFTNRIFIGATVSAAALAVLVLFILIYYVAKHGLSVISFSFLFGQLPAYNGVGGGIGPALLGTLILILIATVIALPAGVLLALYLVEFAGPRADRVLRMLLDLMAGLPTIIAGVFISGLIARRFGESAIAGGLALSIVEVPLIARASLESISRVPPTLREAADALGIARWRTIVGVVLPTASSGIVTATILAVARAAGETAPILFTCDTVVGQGFATNPRHSVAAIPLEIFNLLESGYPAAINKAWGAALVLMVVILLANIGARVLLRRGERKRGL
jgi:phosphate transport system permease protein